MRDHGMAGALDAWLHDRLKADYDTALLEGLPPGIVSLLAADMGGEHPVGGSIRY